MDRTVIGRCGRIVGDSTRLARLPVQRAVSFYLRSWLGWLNPFHGAADMPVVRPSVLFGAQAFVDELAVAAFSVGRRPRGSDEFDRIANEVAEAEELYRARGWIDEPTGFFPEPPPLRDVAGKQRRAGALDYEHVRFESGYEPHPDEPGRDRWLGYRANRTAHAWVLRHREPRPWLVCIHGAGMGHPTLDLRGFRAAWLHHDLGLNLAFPVMPLHGLRRDEPGGPFDIGFPNDDLLDTVHGVAQAAWDVRRLVDWIRAETGEPVGLKGLSLGGYTTGVVAGLVEGLACVIVGVPAVDFAGLFVRHAPPRYRRSGYAHTLGELAPRVLGVVSPLRLRPLVPVERRFIYAGLADRMVHPRHQVRELWLHWDRPSINWYEGSHVAFMFQRPVAVFVADALVESGLVEAERIPAAPFDGG